MTGIGVEGLLRRAWRGVSPNSAVLLRDNKARKIAAINSLRALCARYLTSYDTNPIRQGLFYPLYK